MFKVGQIVRITETAFPGSDDPDDALMRTQQARITRNLDDVMDDYGGIWEVEVTTGGARGYLALVTEDEIAPVE